MLQQIGYLLSLILVILAGVFFLIGIYVGYKYYGQLPSGSKTGYKYFFFGTISVNLALFVFLTVEMGFSWENLGFSAGLTGILAISLKINDIIRIKTAKFLQERNGTFSPLSSMLTLINILTNRHSINQNPDTENENKKK
jgi:hypothetical protein